MTEPTTKPESEDHDDHDDHHAHGQRAAKRSENDVEQTGEAMSAPSDRVRSSNVKGRRAEAALRRPSEVARSSVPLPSQQHQGVDASTPSVTSIQKSRHKAAPSFKSVGEVLGDLFDDFL
jgi:hypothetical protein